MKEKINVTEEDFKLYLEIQKLGIINMFDINSGCEMSGISKDTWKTIMKNYSELKAQYPEAFNEVFSKNIDI